MSRRVREALSWLAVLAGAAAFVWLVSQQALWARVLGALFPEEPRPVFPTSLAALTLQHVRLVGVSSAITVGIGVPLGIFVTRPAGRDFREVLAAAVDAGQTAPPVAVLALATPLLGLGYLPTLVALVLYGLFPVVSGTIAGLEAVPPPVLEAARGMGMGSRRVLATVELPLAARVILGGIRTSVIVNVGTATVGAAIGAGGLGAPIIGGLLVQNSAYILEGAVAAGLLALLLDAFLYRLERSLTPEGVA